MDEDPPAPGELRALALDPTMRARDLFPLATRYPDEVLQNRGLLALSRSDLPTWAELTSRARIALSEVRVRAALGLADGEEERPALKISAATEAGRRAERAATWPDPIHGAVFSLLYAAAREEQAANLEHHRHDPRDPPMDITEGHKRARLLYDSTLANDPEVSPRLLLLLASIYPREVLSNPLLPLLYLDDAHLADEITSTARDTIAREETRACRAASAFAWRRPCSTLSLFGA